MSKIKTFTIESKPDADAYLKDLLTKSRSMDEVKMHAQKLIKDEDLRNYFK